VEKDVGKARGGDGPDGLGHNWTGRGPGPPAARPAWVDWPGESSTKREGTERDTAISQRRALKEKKPIRHERGPSVMT